MRAVPPSIGSLEADCMSLAHEPPPHIDFRLRLHALALSPCGSCPKISRRKFAPGTRPRQRSPRLSSSSSRTKRERRSAPRQKVSSGSSGAWSSLFLAASQTPQASQTTARIRIILTGVRRMPLLRQRAQVHPGRPRAVAGRQDRGAVGFVLQVVRGNSEKVPLVRRQAHLCRKFPPASFCQRIARADKRMRIPRRRVAHSSR